MFFFTNFAPILRKHIAMESIQIKDKKFAISITEEQILKEVDRVAAEINRDLKDKNPLFLSVLNGSFMFTSDLMKRITIPCEISFVKLASYQGISSTGKITEVIGVNEDISGRCVVIVEDIVDTGLTMQRLLETLGTRNPKEIHIASLLIKPENQICGNEHTQRLYRRIRTRLRWFGTQL